MDVFSAAQRTHEHLVDVVNAFVDDVRKITKASRIVAAILFAIAVVRGIGVALIFQSLEHLVDGALGARGVGVVTDDVSRAWWATLFFVLITFASVVAIRRLSGLSLSLVQRATSVLQAVSLLVVAWPMLNAALTIILLLVVLRALVTQRIVIAVSSALIATLTLLTAHDILVFTATRTMTVGSMLAVGGATIYFGLTMAARPYVSKMLS